MNHEFLDIIDENLLNNICDTNLGFSYYYNGIYTNYEIKRKFFLLSLTELGYNDTYDNKSQNKMVLEYFNSNNKRIANNDIGVECPWWTRTKYGGFCAVGYTGGIIMGVTTDAKYGVRPAFTIPNTTKIRQVFD